MRREASQEWAWGSGAGQGRAGWPGALRRGPSGQGEPEYLGRAWGPAARGEWDERPGARPATWGGQGVSGAPLGPAARAGRPGVGLSAWGGPGALRREASREALRGAGRGGRDEQAWAREEGAGHGRRLPAPSAA